MKKFVTLILVLITINAKLFGQEPLSYSEVVQVNDVLKNELFNRAKLWFATTYNSANDVLQIENKEEGELIGKAILKYEPNILSGSEQLKGNIRYTIKIYVKDGRYKYEITDFTHDPYGNMYGKKSMGLITTDMENPNPLPLSKGWSNRVWNDIKSQIDIPIVGIIDNLKKEMIKKTESKNNDW